MLSLETLNKFWEIHIENALINPEKDVIFKWLQNSVESKDSINIKIDDLILFYRDKLSLLNDANITLGGFQCFKSLFCLINEK